MVSVDRSSAGRRTARGLALATAVAACVGLVAACGGGSGGTDSASGGNSHGNPSAPKATGHLGQLQQANSANVGIVNQPPFSGVSPTGGTVGFSPQLAKQILFDLGVGGMKPVLGEYGDMIPGLNAGRWDFVGASLVVTPARCEQVIFSNPIVSDYVRLAHKSGTDAPTSLKALIAANDVKVGMLTGSTYVKSFEAAGLPKSRIVEFNDIRSALDGITAGRVGVVAGSATGFNISGISSQIEFTPRLSDIPPSVSAFAFKKSDTAMRDAFNQDLAKLISDGQYAKILKKWGFTGKEINGLSTQQACTSTS